MTRQPSPGMNETVAAEVEGRERAPVSQAEPFGWTSKHENEDERFRVWGRDRVNVNHGKGYVAKPLYEHPPHPHLRGYQDRVAAAHHALFHDDPTDIEERRARFAEEVNETLQALGMSREDMHRLVDYTWNRPAGEPAKEIGAALLTLTSLCVIAGYDLMACGEADLEKLQRPETIARIRAKRSTRHGRGPLPGIDPTALAAEGPQL